MSCTIFKTERVDPCLTNAVAIGLAHMETVVDDDVGVKIEPDSPNYCGTFIQDDTSSLVDGVCATEEERGGGMFLVSLCCVSCFFLLRHTPSVGRRQRE